MGRMGFSHVACPHCEAISVVPVQFGHFLLLTALGIGGMGTVYRAFDLSLNRYLALKILRKQLSDDTEFIASFSTEARAAASINHPNVTQVYSFGEEQGEYYLAMELLDRGSLDERITRQGRIPEREVLKIGEHMAAALLAAHQKGLLHRDVKPGNILFNSENVAKIVDFGLAGYHNGTELEDPTTDSDHIWGTPYYIAPEKLQGQQEDLRSDIYSLGATLYHALAGRPPFEAETAGEVAVKHTTQPAFSLRTYAPSVQDYTTHVIARMLAKNPSERYQSYDEVIHDMQEAQVIMRAAENVASVTTATGEKFSLASLFGTLAAVVVCAGAGVFVWLNYLRQEVAPDPPSFSLETNTSATDPSSSAVIGEQVMDDPLDEVDFNEDAPWTKSWRLAAQQFSEGRYYDALLGYESALVLVRGRPAHRQWMYYYYGLTLLAVDRPGEARSIFVKSMHLTSKGQIPESITMHNYVETMSQVMVDAIPIEQIEDAFPRMPPWAVTLTQFSLGFKHLEARRYADAALAFRAYRDSNLDDRYQWIFSFQPIDEKLITQCEFAAETIAKIDSYDQGGFYDDAIEVIHSAQSKDILYSLKTILRTREPLLQKAAKDQEAKLAELAEINKRKQQEYEKRQRELARQESKMVEVADKNVKLFFNKYNFRAIQSRYDTLSSQVESVDGKNLLQHRLKNSQLLTEFKTRLSSDFIRRPYKGSDLLTRSSARLSGMLVRATDTHIVCRTPYGEVLTDWGELEPSTLLKLAEYYLTTFWKNEGTEITARRCLTLAAFCKHYEMDRQAVDYAKQAAILQPAFREDVDIVLGKTPEKGGESLGFVTGREE